MRIMRRITGHVGLFSAVLALGLVNSILPAPGQTISFIRQFGTSGDDAAVAVDVNSAGVYVAGFVVGTLPGQTRTGFRDAFVRKYDPNGNELWTRQFGSSSTDETTAGAGDSTGFYVGGFTQGALPGQANAGGFDVFVRKYDPDGNEVWTRQFGASGSDGASTIAADGAAVYVSGIASGSLPGQTGAGGGDAFLRKYDPDGNELWTRQFGTSAYDDGYGAPPVATGVYVAGRTEGTLPGQTSAGGSDAFLRKYDPNGNELWTRQFGSPEFEETRGVAADATGAYVVGRTFGALPGQTSSGGFDVFVRKYDPNGNELWTRQFGTSDTDEGYSVTVDATGVYVGGNTQGILPGQTSAGTVFVRKFDLSGNELWTVQFGSQGGALGVAVDPSGVYVSGSTTSTLPGQTSSGALDAFLAKLDQPDQAGPVTSNVEAQPNPVSIASGATLTATVDDSGTGGSGIDSAHFEIRDDDGVIIHGGAGDNTVCPSPQHLCPVDESGNPEAAPAFDAVMENVEVSIPAGSLTPGVYDACVRGTDANGNTGEFECAYLVVYDPDGGFVTGGGWIQSEPGFCSLNALCAGAEGKANFGFVSKYKKGANVPTGQTQFQFKAGDLNFHSTEYEWLVVSGAMAQYKGSGTINDSGDYGFLLTANDSAIDGGPPEDTFRIKIWDKATETAVYDNGDDQAIGGGSIVIHHQ